MSTPDFTDHVAAPRAALPSSDEAESLALSLLGPLGTKFDHVCTAARVARGLGILFDQHEHHLLVLAAQLHDIGYSPDLAGSGFHPLDGALHLRRLRFDERLVALVAHHSHAWLLAPEPASGQLLESIPADRTLLADALVYADMHSSPAGLLTAAERRVAEINARHANARADERAGALRASVARVESALHRAHRRLRAC